MASIYMLYTYLHFYSKFGMTAVTIRYTVAKYNQLSKTDIAKGPLLARECRKLLLCCLALSRKSSKAKDEFVAETAS